MTKADDVPRPRAGTDGDAVILVNARDRLTGVMGKLEAHQRGFRHRALSVIVRDSPGRLLLQQRAQGKYHSGGLWTNTCCSHPRPGEAADKAAERRLAEEMGIACDLTYLFKTHYSAPVSNDLVENEVVHLFSGRFDGEPSPDPAEVMDWCWKDPSELARDIAERPEAYSVWFRKYCAEFWEALCGPRRNPA